MRAWNSTAASRARKASGRARRQRNQSSAARIGGADHAAAHSFHVVVGADDAVLDGFVVRDGNADGPTYDGKGGGMINYRRAAQSGPMGQPTGFSPIVRNCIFVCNKAAKAGRFITTTVASRSLSTVGS